MCPLPPPRPPPPLSRTLQIVRLLSPNVGDLHHHAHDECDSIGNTRIQFSEFSGVTERPVELTCGEICMRCLNAISPIQLRHGEIDQRSGIRDQRSAPTSLIPYLIIHDTSLNNRHYDTSLINHHSSPTTHHHPSPTAISMHPCPLRTHTHRPLEYDDTGREKKRPMLKFVELDSFPKNWDGIIKCKYSETTRYYAVHAGRHFLSALIRTT